MKVVLLDRDGVINYDRDDYVKNVSELIVIPGVPEAIAKLNRAGFTIIVISNQQAVGKGIVSPSMLEQIKDSIRRSVEAAGGCITAMYHCPHLKEAKCGCRKPEIGMLTQASSDYDFNLSDAWFVGDSPKDFVAGRKAGCKTIAVLTGKLSADELGSLSVNPQHVVLDLAAAADLVIAESYQEDTI